VRDLVKRFPVRRGLLRRTVAHVHAVEGVSFDLYPGETLAIVGESGCGKSTTGRTIARLIDASEGQVVLQGRDITHLSRQAMQPLRRDIQFIFQDPYASLNPRLSALEAVTEPLAIHEPQLTHAQLRARAADLLVRVGLEEAHLDRFPHQFSGGQRQRLCIARALSVSPKVIVADEPVSALDVSVQAQVIALMKQLQEELGLSYIFISHDMGVVERISHRVAVMYLGQIVEIGPTADVLREPRHPYTQRLLASVPIPDPTRRRERTLPDTGDVPSAVRPLGVTIPPTTMVEVAAGHLVANV
jgi:ABC-type dipeptide/oligopeptide/nickel transport system ATPase component